MNMKALMQQAQKMQKDIAKAKEEIDNKVFTGSKSFVDVEVNGKKEILKIKINKEKLDNEDIEMFEDLVLLAINEVFNEVDKETESKMGKFNMGGLGF